MNVEAENIVSRVKGALVQIDESAEVFLYGSQATGTANTASDWDFLFLTTLKVTPALWQKIATSMLDIELEQGIAIQVLPKNVNQWKTKYSASLLYRNIKREGVRL